MQILRGPNNAGRKVYKPGEHIHSRVPNGPFRASVHVMKVGSPGSWAVGFNSGLIGGSLFGKLDPARISTSSRVAWIYAQDAGYFGLRVFDVSNVIGTETRIWMNLGQFGLIALDYDATLLGYTNKDRWADIMAYLMPQVGNDVLLSVGPGQDAVLEAWQAAAAALVPAPAPAPVKAKGKSK